MSKKNRSASTGADNPAAAEAATDAATDTDDGNAAAVAGAIKRGEKVIEIDGHLFTRALFGDLNNTLGGEMSEKQLDERFAEAPAWVEEPVLPLSPEGETFMEKEPEPLVTEFKATPEVLTTDERAKELIAAIDNPAETIANARANDSDDEKPKDLNYAILTVVGPSGNAVTKTIMLGGQNDAGAVSAAFADAIHKTTFGGE